MYQLSITRPGNLFPVVIEQEINDEQLDEIRDILGEITADAVIVEADKTPEAMMAKAFG